MSDTDGAEQCPFCKQASGCEHLLLLVDRTFRNAEGGALKNIFNDRWYKLLEEGGDDLSERDVFESLLEIVNENADESYEWAFEGGPGCPLITLFTSWSQPSQLKRLLRN